MATFCMSIVWILVLSFAMVTLVARTGCIIGVDEFVMGLVIVAIGTSVPVSLSYTHPSYVKKKLYRPAAAEIDSW